MSILRPALAWALYWAGDLVSRWNDHDARFTEAGFQLYQWLMLNAADVQGDGPGPWQEQVPAC
jgi:hypothetical protein